MALEAETETQALPVVGVQPRDAAQWRNDLLIAASLGVLVFALFVLPAVLFRPLFDPSEARVAVAAREMVASGNFALPTIGGEPSLTQPPLSPWVAAFASKALGGDTSERVMTRAVEIPSAVLAALAVFLISLYGGTIGGRAGGILSGLIFGVSVLVTRYAQLGSADGALMFTSAAIFCSAGWLLCVPHAGALSAFAFGASLGLGVLAGGAAPLVFFAPPLLLEIVIRHGFNFRKLMLFAMGLIVAACVAAPWFFIVDSRQPGALNDILTHSREWLTPRSDDPSHTFYLYKLAAGLLPWTPLLLLAWPVYMLKKRSPEEAAANPHTIVNEHLRFLMLAGVCGLIWLSALGGKQEHYLVPLLPPLALASGMMLARLKHPGGMAEERLAWWQMYGGLVLGLAVAAIPLAAPALASHTDEVSKSLVKLNARLSWSLIGVGVVIILASLYCARQWVEGRTVHAGILIAAAAFAGLMGYTFDWTAGRQKLPLAREAPRLSKEASALPEGAKLFAASYAPDPVDPVLTFYLERPVYPLRKELLGPGAPPPPRALLVRQATSTGEQLSILPDVSEDEWEDHVKKATAEGK